MLFFPYIIEQQKLFQSFELLQKNMNITFKTRLDKYFFIALNELKYQSLANLLRNILVCFYIPYFFVNNVHFPTIF